MTTADVRDVAYLDVANPEFSIRSETVLAAREANWYASTPYGIAVLRYNEVSQLLKDRRLGQGSRRWPEHNDVTGTFADWWHRSLINLTGDDHARQRRVSNPAFSPRLVEEMAPMFRVLGNELIDAFIDQGKCEFVLRIQPTVRDARDLQADRRRRGQVGATRRLDRNDGRCRSV